VKGTFELSGRGIVVALDVLDGKVAKGDRVVIPLSDGTTLTTEVSELGFIDRDIGKPTFASHVTLLFRDVRARDAAEGQEIVGADPCQA